MRTLAYFAVLMVLAVLIALVGGCIPAPPPAYTEARAFPSCVVPLSIDSNVPNGAWVRAAFDDIGKHSGYRFSYGGPGSRPPTGGSVWSGLARRRGQVGRLM
jgi:hypothetical protein